MNLTSLLTYLQNKGSRSYLEEAARQALHDEEFRRDYNELGFLEADSNIRGAINNPQAYDNPSIPHQYQYFQRLLNDVIVAHFSYLYDKKGKFSDLKRSVTEVENRIAEANKDIDHIKKTSELIGGAKVLQEYANTFDTRANNLRDNEASAWEKYLYWSFGITAIIISSFFIAPFFRIDWFGFLPEDLKYLQYISFIAVIVRILVFIALIQIIRFCYRNYNAAKHLEHQNRHKSDVLNALFAVHQTIKDENAKDELIKTGALIAFQTTESGYITTKEGAGNADAGLYTIISGFLKK